MLCKQNYECFSGFIDRKTLALYHIQIDHLCEGMVSRGFWELKKGNVRYEEGFCEF